MNMASLGRAIGSIVRPIFASRARLLTQTARQASAWNQDWKPGPYPRTPEERAAAAKKYGLRVEDYEPYPDDGFGYGDYPKLPQEPAEARDPDEDWDLYVERRNYGEPLHVDSDAMVEERWNPKTNYRYTFPQMFTMAFVVMGSIVAAYALMDPYPHFNPAMKKQYPQSGKIHYTFEPVD